MVKLPNQVVMPGAGAAAFQPSSPQPATAPYATGAPPEGPQSFLAFVNIPAGNTIGLLAFELSQFKMSMVQSLLIDNEANPVAITVTSQGGVDFGIPAFGTQIVPLFQKGTQLALKITLAAVQPVQTQIAFQIFNAWVPPASWVSSLAVSGNVNVAAVSGNVNVQVSNAALLGVSLQAATFGGASSALYGGLTNTVVQVKGAPGTGVLKGFDGMSAALGWLQFFDAATPGAVTLGTTTPTYSFPVAPVNTPNRSIFPPEGLKFNNGLQLAWTTTINNATAPASAFQGNIFYA
jgi:hypothetical protein